MTHALTVFGHGSDRPGDALNSRASFERLMGTTVEGVELDVRRTIDDVLAIQHDAATTDGRMLSTVHFDELPPDTMTLAEVLDVCIGRLVNIEIKSYPQDDDYDPSERVTDLVLALLRARGGHDRVLISSFGLPCLDRILADAPHLPTAVLLYYGGDPDELLDSVAAHGHPLVHPYEPHVDDAFMRAARERRLTVNAWTGTDEAWRIGRLVALGVDGIITGRPDLVVL